jgi:uncharacterized protein YeaO (DUF488 family)
MLRCFRHQRELSRDFYRRYRAARRSPETHDALDQLIQAARLRDVTLVFAARDTEHSGAEVLKEVLEERLAGNA